MAGSLFGESCSGNCSEGIVASLVSCTRQPAHHYTNPPPELLNITNYGYSSLIAIIVAR
jgi:hypothetical protein